jgi:Nuclease-related domain
MPQAISIYTSLVGMLAVVGLVVVILFWQRRQRKLRGERPPLETRLLRPAGYSLSIQLQEKEEKLLQGFIVLVWCGAGMAMLVSAMILPFLKPEVQLAVAQHGGWIAVFSERPFLPAALAAGCLTLSVICGGTYGLLSVLKLGKEIRRIYLGLRGEQAVAEKLAELAPDGYRAVHDFPAGKDWNIDHVVVGPGGVFAIETKTRSKRTAPPGKKDQEVLYDGKLLMFPWFTDDKAVRQAEANARWLTNYLKKATGLESVCVTGLLVIPGWYVAYRNSPREHRVRAMPETMLVQHLRDRSRTLSDQEIKQIAFQLDQKCRDVEF